MILSRKDLFSLEQYAENRDEFRAKVMAHKKLRTVYIGKHVSLFFEDRLTIQYQIQEMLRVERIFEAEGIQEELDAYNPLIPNGGNLKATFMLEYPDITQRRKALAELIGIEDKVWVRIEGFDKVYATADEDLERSTEEKTSSVHFLRFEFSEPMCDAAKQNTAIAVGIDHPKYQYEVNSLPENIRSALVADFK